MMARRLKLAPLLAAAWMFAWTTARAGDDLDVKVGGLELKVEIPRQTVSEYHRPYVAMWVQDEKGGVAADLAVWYMAKGAGKETGSKWLPDLRQWWRRSGRKLGPRVDAISGPTPAPGEHVLKPTAEQLANLAPGKYALVVEAVREVGGREVLEVPFTWPVDADATHQAQGKTELGKVTLTVKPLKD